MVCKHFAATFDCPLSPLSLSLFIFLSLVESNLFVKASVNEVSKVTSKQPAVTKPVWNEDILL